MPTVENVARTDAGLASELRVSVMRLRRRLANERDPDNDLSIAIMAVLGSLYRHGDLTVGELAGLERVQPPTMTRKVTSLEEGGYVARRAHVADRKRRDEWLARQLRDLTPQERDVLRTAAPILQRLSERD
jgi:DNA-binding MarR family transcriptional regulator